MTQLNKQMQQINKKKTLYNQEQHNPPQQQQQQVSQQKIKSSLQKYFDHIQQKYKQKKNININNYIKIFPFKKELFSLNINNKLNVNKQITNQQNQQNRIIMKAQYYLNIIKYLYGYLSQLYSILDMDYLSQWIYQVLYCSLQYKQKLIHQILTKVLNLHNSSSLSFDIKNSNISQYTKILNRMYSLHQLWLNQINNNNKSNMNNINKLEQVTMIYNRVSTILPQLLIKQIFKISFNLYDINSNSNLYIKQKLYLINKILLTNNNNHQLIDKCLMINQQQQQINDLNKQSQINHQFKQQDKLIKKCIYQFIFIHFKSIIKVQKIINRLFYYAMRNNSNNNSSNNSNNNQTNEQKQLLHRLVHGYSLNKQLYFVIVQKQHNFLNDYINPSDYIRIYNIVKQINQPQSSQQYYYYFFYRLSQWWQINRDNLITQQMCHLRYNLLAYMIQRSTIDQLQQYKNGILIVNISQGIQKRLIDQKYYKPACLIWNKFTTIMQFQINNKNIKNIQYFQDNKQINKIQKLNYQKQSNKQITHNQYNNNNKINQNKVQQITHHENRNSQTINKQQQSNNTNNKNNTNNNNKNNNVQQYSSDQQYSNMNQENSQIQQITIKPPRTLYDCILALKNPVRRNITIKILPRLLHHHKKDDLLFTWNRLLKQLLFPLQQDCKQSLIILFTLKPKQFIQQTSQIYFKKDASINEKVIFIQILEDGINQLAENPQKYQQKINDNNDDQDKDFYFKRVKSKYYLESNNNNNNNNNNNKNNNNNRTKRWGHTRIAYQKNKSLLNTNNTNNNNINNNNNNNNNNILSSLLIINNNSYINRLYQIANLLFFKLISKICFDMQSLCKKQPILGQHILNLLGTISSKLKNHYDKYLILQDIVIICLKVVLFVQNNNQFHQSSSISIQQLNNQKAKTPLLLNCIQTINKLSLVIDKFIPELMLENVKIIIIKIKKLNWYGFNPILNMIEANIYHRIQLSRDQN